MNWTIAIVLGTLFVLISSALAAMFFGFRDTHRYQSHYDRNGFSQEVREGEQGMQREMGPMNSWQREKRDAFPKS